MPSITTRDGTELYYKDWGAGRPVVFSHGWPLSSDAFEDQMYFLARRGYRCVAHDRRGHGRSGQPLGGNDLNTYADDLAQLVEALDLEGAIHVGHSTGGGEVARYNYKEQAKLVDIIAERIQSLGGISLAMGQDVAEVTRISRPPRGREEVPVQISRLLEAHRTILEEAHKYAAEAAERGDEGTNDLLVSDVIRTNEAQAWFISEHLVDAPLTHVE